MTYRTNAQWTAFMQKHAPVPDTWASEAHTYEIDEEMGAFARAVQHELFLVIEDRLAMTPITKESRDGLSIAYDVCRAMRHDLENVWSMDEAEG